MTNIKYKQWWISINSFFNSQHLTLDLPPSSTKTYTPSFVIHELTLTDRSVECMVSYPAIRLFFFSGKPATSKKKGEKDRIIASLRWDDHRVLRLAVVHFVYGLIKNFLARYSSYFKEFLSHRCRKTGFEAVISHFDSFFFLFSPRLEMPPVYARLQQHHEYRAERFKQLRHELLCQSQWNYRLQSRSIYRKRGWFLLYSPCKHKHVTSHRQHGSLCPQLFRDVILWHA